MPRLTVIAELESGLIEIVKTEIGILPNAKVKVLSLKGRELSEPAQLLLEFLVENTSFLRFDACDIPLNLPS
ncbi:transcriptional regulator LysR family [Vibrio variabilis]|uniref:Transcriptional regulator LysR family n=1 Tax=Vibrio variabilis TaxID=990271 RepID=A0ABQ0J7N9_9VIBR|nr:transcriptional regulator LysR family [Vibrio variabilis]